MNSTGRSWLHRPLIKTSFKRNSTVLSTRRNLSAREVVTELSTGAKTGCIGGGDRRRGGRGDRNRGRNVPKPPSRERKTEGYIRVRAESSHSRSALLSFRLLGCRLETLRALDSGVGVRSDRSIGDVSKGALLEFS